MRYALCALPLDRMNLFFAFPFGRLHIHHLSLCRFPGSLPVALFNPFSLLHIPLYLILTLLIVLSIVPFHLFRLFRSNRCPLHLPVNASTHEQVDDLIGPGGPDGLNALNQINPTNPINQRNRWIRFLIAGFISFVVAVADEYHQSFIPTREASFTDILLDIMGIVLALGLSHS